MRYRPCSPCWSLFVLLDQQLVVAAVTMLAIFDDEGALVLLEEDGLLRRDGHVAGALFLAGRGSSAAFARFGGGLLFAEFDDLRLLRFLRGRFCDRGFRRRRALFRDLLLHGLFRRRGDLNLAGGRVDHDRHLGSGRRLLGGARHSVAGCERESECKELQTHGFPRGSNLCLF